VAIIKLPKKEVIAQDEETITVDLPESIAAVRKKIDYSKILQSKGILKDKKEKFLEYAERTRKEWE
jgi:hypothetical protein